MTAKDRKGASSELTKRIQAMPPQVVDALMGFATNERLVNGLQDALCIGQQGIGGGMGGVGFPFAGAQFGEAIEQGTPLWKNLRWYLVSNWRQVLSQAYVEIGLVSTICDVPVDDGLRGGVEIKSKQLSEEQIEELQISVDRDDDLTTVGTAAKWNRLYGGAGVLILTDQDPETELELSQITADSTLEFRAVDMWELFWDKQNTEGYDPAVQSQDFEFYNYYGEQVHKSRVMRLKGLTAPSFIRPRLRGWGFSVVEVLVRSINQYFKGQDLAYEVLDEFKVDVYKIKNLASTLMAPLGEQAIRKRIMIANREKNYNNAVTMDAEDDWDHKQLSFAGLAETMAQIRIQVAADMRMPLTKLFGISAAGFNSGEDDIEVYNSMVESQVRNKLKYDILRILEIKCQKLFGFIPDDLSILFKPLRMLSAEQEENVKTQKFTRLSTAFQTGQISDLEFRQACNKGDLFDIKLDTEADALGGDVSEMASDDGEDPEKATDVDDPGANRLDTRKARATEKGGAGKEPPAPKSADAPEVKAKAPTNIRAGKISKGKGNVAPDAPSAPKAATKIPKVKTATENSTELMRRVGLLVLPGPFTAYERARRVVNSAEFDRRAYEADGGDGWIDPRNEPFFPIENPGKVDEGLWAKAKDASQAALGKIKWQFVTWWYKKQGGKFG